MNINDYVLKFNEEFYYPIKEGVKESTIRKSSKPLNVGDYVVAFFPELKKGLLLKIVEHYAKKLNELSYIEAACEGYCHKDLLIHAIKLHETLTEYENTITNLEKQINTDKNYKEIQQQLIALQMDISNAQSDLNKIKELL